MTSTSDAKFSSSPPSLPMPITASVRVALDAVVVDVARRAVARAQLGDRETRSRRRSRRRRGATARGRPRCRARARARGRRAGPARRRGPGAARPRSSAAVATGRSRSRPRAISWSGASRGADTGRARPWPAGEGRGSAGWRGTGRAGRQASRPAARRLVQVGEIQAALRRRLEQPLGAPLRIRLVGRAAREIGGPDHGRHHTLTATRAVPHYPRC